MIVGGIETGTMSTIYATATDRLTIRDCHVGGVGGSGVSVSLSNDAAVTGTLVHDTGANGFEFSRVSTLLLAHSKVSTYGRVMAGAAGVELDQCPNATVTHNQFDDGEQNGGINLDCHDGCTPTTLAKNHLFNLGTRPKQAGSPLCTPALCFVLASNEATGGPVTHRIE